MDDKNEQLHAAQACNRDVPGCESTAKQDCSDVVHLSLFFDGTGNNKDVDEKPKKWSNVARMWLSATFAIDLVEGAKNIHAIYISGVGTPFNGTATGWLDKAGTSVQDTAFGNAGGGGGTRRTEFGQSNVNDALRQVLITNASKLGGVAKAYADKSKDKSFAELSMALGGHRLIKVINISIFGFSRGAALARAFSNDFIKLCKKDQHGQLTYKEIPVRLQFMGLFDTVASFGAPSANMDGLFSEKNLRVPSQSERCVHYVAAHELRFSFPVDLIRQKGQLASSWTETVYPGVHSDVGGGYLPLATNGGNDDSANQGITNNLARIPMRDMMGEAIKSGVRMYSYREVEKLHKAVFIERFAIEPKTQELYNNYMASVAPNGSIEQVIAAHMKALYSAYGTMTRKGIKTADVVQKESSLGNRLIGHDSMAREAELLLNPGKAIANDVKTISPVKAATRTVRFIGENYGQVVNPEAWRLEAWKATANDHVVAFVRNMVHDSKSGFLMSIEPFSYFRPRGMTESSHNVLAQGLQWLEKSAVAAKEGVIKVYHTAQGVVVETWNKGVLVATRTYKIGEKFVIDTVHAGEKYAVEVYQTSKEVVISTVETGQRVIVSSINTVQTKATELADATEKKATELADAAGKKSTELMNAAEKKSTELLHAAQKGASDMAHQVSEGAKQVSETVGNTIDAGMSAVENGWKASKAALGF
ncbi:Uncharacterized alpha/beta hydrolase domain [Duganella sp. CF458]|uniref:T6SS phospholipase effector Tle1-like catalytic domain-containing protein n=1 Tax=Duganella sp. CF458 TaxID=1884368 RepID=UPI0008E299E4|nr:DUF2235 domain-containing protein [Duganella sp. CF458]SFG12145.1 Uncharacterized alpha/beta hydrolase domain [Duganella sp. CF458]